MVSECQDPDVQHTSTQHTQTQHRHFSWLANGYPIFSLIPAPDKHIPRILHTVYVCSLLYQAICSNFPCPEAVLAAPSLSSHSNERQSSRRSTTHYCNAVTCQITTFPQLLRASAIQQPQGVKKELAAARIRDEIVWPPYVSFRPLFRLLYFSSLSLGWYFFCCPPRTAIPWYKSCHESFVSGQIGLIINYTRTLPSPEKTNKNAGKTKSQEKRSECSSAIMLFYQV